ncbi:MAG: hypothetical protein JWO00_233 [Candidatus Parcubacteria bacterium]|nr:hypothetical protein [Candidatus Parcubacteria bacterium]
MKTLTDRERQGGRERRTAECAPLLKQLHKCKGLAKLKEEITLSVHDPLNDGTEPWSSLHVTRQGLEIQKEGIRSRVTDFEYCAQLFEFLNEHEISMLIDDLSS